MKFAILSDIHSNLPALEAVIADIDRWKPDFVIVNGDVINRGPNPADCWILVQEKVKNAGWYLNMGNHEEYVLNDLNPNKKGKHFPMSWWTLSKVKPYIDEIKSLGSVWSCHDLECGEIRVTHASMIGSRNGIYPSDSIEKIREYIAPAPDVLCVGHIHLPYLRRIDQTLLVNSGSAGQPCYGEKNGTYAQITWGVGGWDAEIRRVPYDRKETHRHWFTSGILEETDLMTHIIYHEWRTAHPLVLKWIFEYEPLVGKNDVTEVELFKRFLKQENLGRASQSDPL